MAGVGVRIPTSEWPTIRLESPHARAICPVNNVGIYEPVTRIGRLAVAVTAPLPAPLHLVESATGRLQETLVDRRCG
jgi:hypothetical protein